ncbi:hypothetical protein M2137_000698, partial [Parabacteroides sp. PFB2-10]|nr:hypothetical protein [Parabacteroides sp. PFB2-10]
MNHGEFYRRCAWTVLSKRMDRTVEGHGQYCPSASTIEF